jgi:hypothetical protein
MVTAGVYDWPQRGPLQPRASDQVVYVIGAATSADGGHDRPARTTSSVLAIHGRSWGDVPGDGRGPGHLPPLHARSFKPSFLPGIGVVIHALHGEQDIRTWAA